MKDSLPQTLGVLPQTLRASTLWGLHQLNKALLPEGYPSLGGGQPLLGWGSSQLRTTLKGHGYFSVPLWTSLEPEALSLPFLSLVLSPSLAIPFPSPGAHPKTLPTKPLAF